MLICCKKTTTTKKKNKIEIVMVISRIRLAAKVVAQAAAHGGGHHDHIHTKIVPREIATAIVLGIFCKSIFLDYVFSTPVVLVTDA